MVVKPLRKGRLVYDYQPDEDEMAATAAAPPPKGTLQKVKDLLLMRPNTPQNQRPTKRGKRNGRAPAISASRPSEDYGVHPASAPALATEAKPRQKQSAVSKAVNAVKDVMNVDDLKPAAHSADAHAMERVPSKRRRQPSVSPPPERADGANSAGFNSDSPSATTAVEQSAPGITEPCRGNEVNAKRQPGGARAAAARAAGKLGWEGNPCAGPSRAGSKHKRTKSGEVSAPEPRLTRQMAKRYTAGR